MEGDPSCKFTEPIRWLGRLVQNLGIARMMSTGFTRSCRINRMNRLLQKPVSNLRQRDQRSHPRFEKDLRKPVGMYPPDRDSTR